ncbi:cupin domain-containing protein [Thalassobacillus pellis]|uniref:cupin domain-containing protein n=1 Tax=Thalassobacillus pellis TaxID=748008 RepID=UPI0019618A77|nr:cupin domain-containing protein [Thalassobacillus pellis]MBM7553502.1 quercetin dioxygenase-like cupin family protein [Thalassobacillus pellis]
MHIFRFDKEAGQRITKFDSNFILSKIVKTKTPAFISGMHLDAGGNIGYHEAVVPQLLLVVNGEGTVSGKENSKVTVKAGDAVFWEQGEWHETTSEHGMTAIVVESEELDPASL